jgi:hypothetical protein
MPSGAPAWEGRFIEVGQKLPECSTLFPGILGAEVDDAGMALRDIVSLCQLYLAAKPSHVGVDVDGLACPAPSYGLLPSDEVSGLLIRYGLLSSYRSGRWHLSGGCKAPGLRYLMGVLTVWVPALLNLLHGVNHFYQGILIPCQSHHGAYACIPSRAVVSGGDVTDSNNWVHVVRHVWAPIATSCRARWLSPPPLEAPGRAMLICSRRTPNVPDRRPEYCPGSSEVGPADKWQNPTCPLLSYGGKSEGLDYSRG